MSRIFVFMVSAFVQGQALLASHTCTPGKKLSIIVAGLLFMNLLYAQGRSVDTSSLPAKKTIDLVKTDGSRVWLVAGVSAMGYGGSLIILNNTWYKNYAHTSFHTFNDSKEWLQVDKAGHGWTAFNTARASASMWHWAGLEEKKSALVGGVTGAAYLTAIEFLDAHSAKWGWSWSDIGANIFGSGFFVSQQLLWGDERIQYKFSFHHKDYADAVLNKRADDLFGKVWYERMLKDYNAQTYWLSVNLRSFFSRSNLPA